EGAYGTGAVTVFSPQSSSAQDLQLPLDIQVSLNTLKNRYARVAATTPENAEKRHAELMVKQINDGTLRTAMREKVTTWTFSTSTNKPLALIAMAGEPTV